MTSPARNPNPIRKSLSAKTRFEVFKRDGFSCGYCGRKTPAVVLEVDHIIPVVEGGSGDFENLVTSCWECNRGKGKTLLDDRAPTFDIHDQAVFMLERELQLREYNAVKGQVNERIDREISYLLAYWDDFWNSKEPTQPWASVLRHALRYLPAEDIREAMCLAAERSSTTSYKAAKYFTGIIKNKVREHQPPEQEDDES